MPSNYRLRNEERQRAERAYRRGDLGDRRRSSGSWLYDTIGTSSSIDMSNMVAPENMYKRRAQSSLDNPWSGTVRRTGSIDGNKRYYGTSTHNPSPINTNYNNTAGLLGRGLVQSPTSYTSLPSGALEYNTSQSKSGS